MKKLTKSQELFVNSYIKHGDAAKALEDAGYRKISKAYYKALAGVMLSKPHVKDRIQFLLKNAGLSAEMVVTRLSEQATASFDDFFIETPEGVSFDLRLAKEKGKMGMVKKITLKDGIVQSIELHDSQSALVHLGKIHRLFTDRIETVTWETRAVEMIKGGEISFPVLAESFGEEKARSLFMTAGVKIE